MVDEIGDIEGIGPKTEESLNEAGINSIDDLATSDIDVLTSVGMSTSRAKELKHKAKQSTIQIVSGDDVKEEYENQSKVSSGIDGIDNHVTGGWGEGDIVALYGSDGTGKTQLCFKSLVTAVEETGKECVYIETEPKRFRPKRIEQLSNKEDTLNKIHRVKAYDLEQQESAYDKIAESFDELGLVVIDSLTARFRLSDKFEDRSTLSERSSILGRHLNKIERMCRKLQCPVLVTAQVFQSPSQYSSGDMMYGGSLIKHTILYKVYMDESSGEMFEATIEQHPTNGEKTVVLNITKNDVVEV